MASKNEVSKPASEAGVEPEKEVTSRSRNSRRGSSKRSSKKKSKKESSKAGECDQQPPSQEEEDEGTTQQTKQKQRSRSASLMRKLSVRKKEKTAERNLNCRDENDTKSGINETRLTPTKSEVFSNSSDSISFASKDGKRLSLRPPIEKSENSQRENSGSFLSSKLNVSPKPSKSASIRKTIAVNSGGKAIAFEYVADKPNHGSGAPVTAIYKASMSPKAATKLFGKMKMFKKESSKASKPEKEKFKHVSKLILKGKKEKTSSDERKKEVDNTTMLRSNSPKFEEKDVQKSKCESSTLIPQNISAESSSNDTVDGLELICKREHSSECITNIEQENNTVIDNDKNENNTQKGDESSNPFYDTHTVNEGNLHQNWDNVEESVLGENYRNSNEKFDPQTVPNSISTEPDLQNKFDGEKSISGTETLKMNLESMVHEISDPEIEQTGIAKSPALEDMSGEITEEKIESTAVTSSSRIKLDDSSQKNDAPPKKPHCLERDNSRFNFAKLFDKKTAEIEPTPSEENSLKGESESALTTSSGLDHEDQHQSSSKSGFFRGGMRGTKKNKKGNVKTIDGPNVFPLKYMRVHGDADKAYKNESEPRGLIFMKNVESFSGTSFNDRSGSKEDFTNLLCLFSQMGYIPAENLCESGFIKKDRLIRDLKSFAKLNHKKYHSAIIIIMSHGVEDKTFVTSDEKQVQLSKVYSILNNNNCSELKGKPKIFIFQFCRPSAEKRRSIQIVNSLGETLDVSVPKSEKKTDIRRKILNFLTMSKIAEGSDPSINRSELSQLDVVLSEDSETEVEDEESPEEVACTGVEVDSQRPQMPKVPSQIPDNSDMYSIFATQAGGVAYRDPKKGSLLIQAICDVFSQHAYQDDIDALVRKVSQHVQHKASDPHAPATATCQPGVVERVNLGLDKLFFFNPYPRGVMRDGMLIDTTLLEHP